MTLRVITVQIGASECRYASLVKSCPRVVVLKRESAHFINVISGSYPDSRIQEATRQPSRTAEEVNRSGCFLNDFWHLVTSVYEGEGSVNTYFLLTLKTTGSPVAQDDGGKKEQIPRASAAEARGMTNH